MADEGKRDRVQREIWELPDTLFHATVVYYLKVHDDPVDFVHNDGGSDVWEPSLLARAAAAAASARRDLDVLDGGFTHAFQRWCIT